MTTITDAELRALPSREYAVRGDRCIGASESMAHDLNADAIGGAYGIAWYDVFENEKGERYKVYCWDGERTSRGPYCDEDRDLDLMGRPRYGSY